MAGIGYELRRIMQRGTLLSMLTAYGYAGVIGSGPWVLSIVGVLAVGLLAATIPAAAGQVAQFQVAVTYLIAASLIVTGPWQLSFTRFVADRLFEGRNDAVLPNFQAVLLLVTWASGAIGFAVALFGFPQEPLAFRLAFAAALVLLSNIWIATILLSGLKQYQAIVVLYALGYGVSVLAALLLARWGLSGLMAGFALGQAVLLAGMLGLIIREFPADTFMAFEFFRRDRHFRSLMLAGAAYNLAIWLDKFMFWFTPATSQAIIGPLRASVIYDLPIFLAYLSIIPGMAVFLLRLETDFVEHYDNYCQAVREGGSLSTIERHRNGMVESARLGLFEIVKIQAIAALLTIAAGETLLAWLGISPLYAPLLSIMVVGAGLQVLLLGVLNVLYYLDRRRLAASLVLLFLLANGALTAATLALGPEYFGYGYAGSVLIACVAGLIVLDRVFERLEYETFMLQPAAG
ncbi:MAG: exopolysaccharide Pel transporter PelG [Burkholderiaceae bacterium]|nr:exopolysaccharide Pel transporter PelG [Burkholderiaceae bacterium]